MATAKNNAESVLPTSTSGKLRLDVFEQLGPFTKGAILERANSTYQIYNVLNKSVRKNRLNRSVLFARLC